MLTTPARFPFLAGLLPRLAWLARGVLLGASACALAACSPELAEQIEQVGEGAREILEEHLGDADSRPLVQSHDLPYLDSRRVAHEGTMWLHEWVDMQVSELPMNLSLAKALEQLSAPPSVVFTADLTRPEIPVTLTHRGPFRNFLDLLAEASGYGWEQKGGTLYWMAEITRTFDIHRVPGDISFSMETQSSTETVLQGSGDEIDAALDPGGEISIDGGGTFWDDLENTLGTLIPAGSTATFTIDRSTGTVVARGPAREVRQVGRYIDALNRWLGRQVLLEIQLVTVTLNDERQFGIDWNLVRDSMNATRAASLTSLTGAGAASAFGGTAGALLSLGFGSLSGSIFRGPEDDPNVNALVITALEDQGETSVQNSPRIVAMNGQAAQLQVQNDQTIVASRTTTTTGTLGTTEASIEPGTVSTGITVTILPKIIGSEVIMQANIQVSNLIALTEGGGAESISLPQVQRNQFFQSARLNSGETLVLGGLINREGRDSGKHLPGVPAFGKSTLRYSRIETVLLISPTLLDPPAPDEALLR